MNGSDAKKLKVKKIKIAIIIAASVIIFIFFGTLLTDMALIKNEHTPFFSNISKMEINEGEIVVGRGILYKTAARRIDVSNGYLAGYAIFFPWDEEYGSLETSPPVISMQFYGSLDDSGAYSAENISGEEDDGESIELDDMTTLNMDLIQSLADGEIDPFDFMEKFPGTVYEEVESEKYFLRLMNNYALQIEYSGDTVIEMRLIDELYNQYIDIEKQMIDTFINTLRPEE